MKKQTFGESLSYFARSRDIFDTAAKYDILSLVGGYLRDEFDIRHFMLYVKTLLDQRDGLTSTVWNKGGEDSCSFTIRDADGRYSDHVSLAYDRDVPLWIISPYQRTLHATTPYKDLLGNAAPEEISEHTRRTEHEILTSIVFPIKNGSHIYGVIHFGSVRFLEYNSSIERELRMISGSISTLFLLNKVYESQIRNTKRGIMYLSSMGKYISNTIDV